MNWQPSPNATDAVVDIDDQSDDFCNLHYGGKLIGESIERSKQPLISAAPDLLAACQLLADFRRPSKRDWDNGACRDDFDKAREAAIAAIKKARVKS